MVSLNQGREGSLPAHQVASLLWCPEDERVRGALCAECLHIPAIKLLPCNAYPELFCKPLVSLLPVQTGSAIAWTLSTLYRSVDGHRSCSQAGLQATCLVLCVGLPRPIDKAEHTWLWRLRCHKEPES